VRFCCRDYGIGFDGDFYIGSRFQFDLLAFRVLQKIGNANLPIEVVCTL
jgi:hypothetical protein